MHPDETSLELPSHVDVKPSLAQARSRETIGSRMLLTRAVSLLGIDKLADGLGLAAADVERLLATDCQMTLAQQRVLAIAVLVLSDTHRALHRRARALLAQVHAAEDFHSGITERHNSPPSAGRW